VRPLISRRLVGGGGSPRLTRSGPLLRGLELALEWASGARSDAQLSAALRAQWPMSARDPDALGRLLAGLLLPGGSVLYAASGAVEELGRGLERMSGEAFEAALPDLRFGFSVASQEERSAIGRSALPAAPELMSQGGELERALAEELRREGLSELSVEPGEPVAGADPQAEQRPRDAERDRRWRLILGRAAGEAGLGDEDRRREGILRQLYDDRQRQAGPSKAPRQVPPQSPSLNSSLRRAFPGPLSQPGPSAGARAAEALAWLANVRASFAPGPAERMLRHAVERYGMLELLSDARVLRSLPGSLELVRGLVRARSVLSPEALAQARRMIDELARKLRPLFEKEVRPVLTAALRARERSPLRLARNLDVRRTLRRNLKNYDAASGTLGIQEVLFTRRASRHRSWRIVLVVDRSGSMVDAQVHMAVLAGVFHALPAVQTHLIGFDVEPTDLTAQVDDPAALLLSEVPEGGTAIAPALEMAAGKAVEPRRTFVVLLSDLGEGADPEAVVAQARRLKESGAQLIALYGLGPGNEVAVDEAMRGRLEDAGVPVGSLAPRELARWLAERMR
jgi:Mg-chelatase subunit ChlD